MFSPGQGQRFRSNHQRLSCGNTNCYFHPASIAMLVVWTIALIYFCWSRDVRTLYNQIINSLQERSKARKINCEICSFSAEEKFTLMWISALCCSIDSPGSNWFIWAFILCACTQYWTSARSAKKPNRDKVRELRGEKKLFLFSLNLEKFELHLGGGQKTRQIA